MTQDTLEKTVEVENLDVGKLVQTFVDSVPTGITASSFTRNADRSPVASDPNASVRSKRSLEPTQVGGIYATSAPQDAAKAQVRNGFVESAPEITKAQADLLREQNTGKGLSSTNYDQVFQAILDFPLPFTVKKIAKKTGVSTTGVKASMARLVEEGYAIVIRQGGGGYASVFYTDPTIPHGLTAEDFDQVGLLNTTGVDKVYNTPVESTKDLVRSVQATTKDDYSFIDGDKPRAKPAIPIVAPSPSRMVKGEIVSNNGRFNSLTTNVVNTPAPKSKPELIQAVTAMVDQYIASQDNGELAKVKAELADTKAKLQQTVELNTQAVFDLEEANKQLAAIRSALG